MSQSVTTMLVMQKFVLIYHGYQPRTPHLVAAWNTWLQRRAASISDFGSPFGPGRRITNHATVEFSLASNPASGYSIIEAPHIDAAEQLLEGCPIAESITLYQALPTAVDYPPDPRNQNPIIDRPRPTTVVDTKPEGNM